MSYKRGEHNMIDDLTGFKHKSGDMKELQGEQKGLFTHRNNWEPLNPQLYIKPRRADRQNVSNERSRQTTTFITTAITQDDL